MATEIATFRAAVEGQTMTSEPGSAAMELVQELRRHAKTRQSNPLLEKTPRILDTARQTMWDAANTIETLTSEAREALTWQPMSSAPLDREILLDVSYWYPGDTSVTACYFIGSWASNMWDCGEEFRRSDQINAWMNIPATTLPRPAPEALAGGKQE